MFTFAKTVIEMLLKIPTARDRSARCNANAYKIAWNGYKLHIDTADCGVPINALLLSASMHDSRAEVLILDERRTGHKAVRRNGRRLLQCRTAGKVAQLGTRPANRSQSTPRPQKRVRTGRRDPLQRTSVAERSNARLENEFGARNVMVKV